MTKQLSQKTSSILRNIGFYSILTISILGQAMPANAGQGISQPSWLEPELAQPYLGEAVVGLFLTLYFNREQILAVIINSFRASEDTTSSPNQPIPEATSDSGSENLVPISSSTAQSTPSTGNQMESTAQEIFSPALAPDPQMQVMNAVLQQEQIGAQVAENSSISDEILAAVIQAYNTTISYNPHNGRFQGIRVTVQDVLALETVKKILKTNGYVVGDDGKIRNNDQEIVSLKSIMTKN